jgi:hypothetical protein
MTCPCSVVLPSGPDNIGNNAVILMLLQATNDNNSNDTLDALDPNGDGTAMDRVARGLIRAQAELGSKKGLVSVKLAVHEPRAAAEAERGGTLAPDPDLVVRQRARVRGTLEDDQAAGEGNADDGRLPLFPTNRHQPSVEKMTEMPGVVGGKRRKSERVAPVLDELLGLRGRLAFLHQPQT